MYVVADREIERLLRPESTDEVCCRVGDDFCVGNGAAASLLPVAVEAEDASIRGEITSFSRAFCEVNCRGLSKCLQFFI